MIITVEIEASFSVQAWKEDVDLDSRLEILNKNIEEKNRFLKPRFQPIIGEEYDSYLPMISPEAKVIFMENEDKAIGLEIINLQIMFYEKPIYLARVFNIDKHSEEKNKFGKFGYFLYE